MSENWTADEYGFLTNGKEFFRIKDLCGVGKKDRDTVVLYFFARILDIKFENPADQSSMYDFFITAMKNYAKACREHDELHHKMHGASLEIQNRLAGAIVK